ncbi:MAG: GntR family transcriptional regulator [Solirubrobacteraceae bacterium]
MSDARAPAAYLPADMPVVVKPPTLAEHVCVVLRDDIFAGRLQPGDRLSEAFITERTGVSRSPVREALRLLQAEGLVHSQRGRGAYVSYRLSADEAERIYRCRLDIEPYMTGLAAEHATTEDIRRYEAILDRFTTAIQANADGTEVSAIDGDFHSAIYDTSRSALIVIFRSYWARLRLQLSTLVYGRETPQRFYEEHIAILNVLREHDAPAAESLMAAHIEHGRRRITESFAEEGKS